MSEIAIVMTQNVFTPNFNRKPAVAPDAKGEAIAYSAKTQNTDRMSSALILISRLSVVCFVFFLPLFFMPGLWASLGFQKTLLAMSVVVVVLVMLSLLMLRHNRVQTLLPMPLLCFFCFVGVAGVSAIFSDDPIGGLRGNVIETGTVTFVAIMAAVMSVTLVLQQSKKYTMRALQALVVSALLLLTYTVGRLFLGPIASFGSFNTVTTSPLGGFNDLAAFAGLVVLVSLIALLQLPLRTFMQALLLSIVALSLVVLAVVGFKIVWLITGFFGLLVLLYIVARDRIFVSVEGEQTESQKPSVMLLIATVLVCVTSAWFIIMSDTATSKVGELFGVSYLEVRPNFASTVDIAKQVYDEDLLLGTGPNQFVTSWRLYKDPRIVEDPYFWSTDFLYGSSYVTTMAVSTGLLGIIVLLAFHGWYLWFGVRMLVKNKVQDKFWYFVGVVTFAGASFLWLMTYLYVPGATMLLLAAVLTGLSFVAGGALMPQVIRSIPLVTNQSRGFGLMALAILLISGAVGVLFTVGEQYIAYASFNKTQATAQDVAAVDQAAMSAYAQYADDTFLGVRSRIALLEMNQLLSVAEPSEAQQQQFLDVSERGVAVARQAVTLAPENPEYRVLLAAMYHNLALAGVEGALALATSSLEIAKQLDPHNPTFSLVEAQLAARRGDAASARQALQAALEKKRNFTEALYLLAQIDIAEGNVDAAIETTQSIITLEPNNPTRYYQLGILFSAAEDAQAAVEAYSAALALDPYHANARYFRALLLADAGEIETAISELQIVQETNQENESLATLIEQLSDGTITASSSLDSVEVPVSELSPETSDETVTSPVAPESDLLTPLNAVPNNSTEETVVETTQTGQIENDEPVASTEDQ